MNIIDLQCATFHEKIYKLLGGFVLKHTRKLGGAEFVFNVRHPK
jgi:hypothetical protein